MTRLGVLDRGKAGARVGMTRVVVMDTQMEALLNDAVRELVSYVRQSGRMKMKLLIFANWLEEDDEERMLNWSERPNLNSDDGALGIDVGYETQKSSSEVFQYKRWEKSTQKGSEIAAFGWRECDLMTASSEVEKVLRMETGERRMKWRRESVGPLIGFRKRKQHLISTRTMGGIKRKERGEENDNREQRIEIPSKDRGGQKREDGITTEAEVARSEEHGSWKKKGRWELRMAGVIKKSSWLTSNLAPQGKKVDDSLTNEEYEWLNVDFDRIDRTTDFYTENAILSMCRMHSFKADESGERGKRYIPIVNQSRQN
ncbi:hypothetical protein BY996DRAFT_6610607 [Phakopsora pachyrhizi]|nr:hypothetical protein BY996DRAFT_6610607 [Phakopsora pachyrhizi]